MPGNTKLLLKEVQNLKGIVDDSLNESDEVLAIYETHEQEIIRTLLEKLDECRGKLQVTNAPNFYMGRISALKDCLRMYGVKI